MKLQLLRKIALCSRIFCWTDQCDSKDCTHESDEFTYFLSAAIHHPPPSIYLLKVCRSCLERDTVTNYYSEANDWNEVTEDEVAFVKVMLS